MEPRTEGEDEKNDMNKSKQKNFSGKVRLSALEGGFWQLDADDGKRYQLVGSLKGLKDGQSVEVDGEIEEQRLSFAMIGPVLRVKRIRKT